MGVERTGSSGAASSGAVSGAVQGCAGHSVPKRADGQAAASAGPATAGDTFERAGGTPGIFVAPETTASPRPAQQVADSTATAGEEMQGMQVGPNLKFLQLQSQMQHENRTFTLVSNIMKTKHDTTKNSIGNVR